jgi:hypothetical protein
MKPPGTRARFPLIVLMLVAVGIAGFVGFRQLHPVAFPEYAIDLQVTPEQAADRSTEYLRDVVGVDVSGYSRTTVWGDNPARAYLEQEFGVERTAAIGREVGLWGFVTRYVDPEETEDIRVQMAPDGRVMAYQRLIDDDEPGARLKRDQALEIAEAARRDLVLLRGDWQLIDSSKTDQSARRDWTFTWKCTDLPLVTTRPDGRDLGAIVVQVTVHGDHGDLVFPSVRPAPGWAQDHDRVNATKQFVSDIDWFVGFYALIPVALIVCLYFWGQRGLQWRTVLVLALVAGLVQALDVVNQLPIAMFQYDESTSWLAFLASRIGESAFGSMWEILLFGLAGEALYRRCFPRHLTLRASFGWRGLMTRSAAVALSVGTLVGILNGAFQTVYYILGAPVGFWSPVNTRYYDVVNALVPWLQPLPDAYDAPAREDFHYRLFAIPLLYLFFVLVLRRERLSLWLAIVPTAFVWGFAHTNYPHEPFYARGLEIGLVGIVAGWLMVRYGILAALAAHFTFDALSGAYSIENAGSVWVSLLAYGIVAIPLAVATVAVIRARVRGGFVEEAGLLNEELSRRLAESLAVEPRPSFARAGVRRVSQAIGRAIGQRQAAVPSLGRVAVMPITQPSLGPAGDPTVQTSPAQDRRPAA